MTDYSLYVHIPFCIKKCNYCDFVSYSGLEARHGDYTKALLAEMGLYRGQRLRTVYIGGGTPTCMDSIYVSRILKGIGHFFDISCCKEMSIEANPCTLTEEMLLCLKENGVNRLSIGLQSWNPRELNTLGRSHSVRDFLKSYTMARELGFDNINIDLMFGLPDQTMNSWGNTLRRVTDLNPEHLSCYSLIIEEGTKLHSMIKKGLLREPEPELDRAMYHYGVNYLLNKGYNRYEISNFAREGKECIHNLSYWNNSPYIGIGVAAHSYSDGIRRWNTKDIYKYLNMLKTNQPAAEGFEQLSPKERIFEAIFLKFRTPQGINFEEFEQRFGKDFRNLFGEQIARLKNNGFIETNGENLWLTPKGIDLSNSVFIEFLE